MEANTATSVPILALDESRFKRPKIAFQLHGVKLILAQTVLYISKPGSALVNGVEEPSEAISLKTGWYVRVLLLEIRLRQEIQRPMMICRVLSQSPNTVVESRIL
jgi:hypothetical protein